MAAGQVLLLDDRYVAFRLTELLSVILVILYAVSGGSKVIGSRTAVVGTLPSRNIRLLATDYRLPLSLGLLLLVAVNFGWIGGSLLYRHVEVINFLPAWLSRGSVILESTTTGAARVGFSTSGKLSTVLAIKEDADTAPVLTVTGNNPTYLRAMAFETYNQSAWHDLSYREAISPEQNTPFGMLMSPRMFLFRLRDAGSEEDPPLRETIIRHEASVGDSMFTPLGTCFVEAPFGLLMRDDDDTITSPNVRNRQSYRASYTAAPANQPATGSQLRRLTAVPSQLVDQRLQQLAGRLFHNCKTTAEKIERRHHVFSHDLYVFPRVGGPARERRPELLPAGGLQRLLRVFRLGRRDPAADGRRPDPLRHRLSGHGTGRRQPHVGRAEHGCPRLGRSVGRREPPVGDRRGHHAGRLGGCLPGR